MAKKKKKKNIQAPGPDQKESARKSAPEPSNIKLEKNQPERKDESRPETRKKSPASVSPLVCAAAMVFCLALGFYLGTLAPTRNEPAAPPVPPEVPAPTAEIAPTPPESDSGLSPDLRQRLANLRETAERNPGNAQVWTELGNLYFDTRDHDGAIAAYEKSLSIEPDNPDVLTDLGIMYRDTEQFAKAVKCFRRASAIDPGHVNSLYNEGIVLSSDLHNAPEAARAWEKLLRINPDARSPDGVPVSEMLKKLRY